MMKGIHDKHPDSFKVYVNLVPQLRFEGGIGIPLDVKDRQIWELTKKLEDLQYCVSTEAHVKKRMQRELTGNEALNTLKRKVVFNLCVILCVCADECVMQVAKLEQDLEIARNNQDDEYEVYIMRYTREVEEIRRNHAEEVYELEDSIRKFCKKLKDAEEENKKLKDAGAGNEQLKEIEEENKRLKEIINGAKAILMNKP